MQVSTNVAYCFRFRLICVSPLGTTGISEWSQYARLPIVQVTARYFGGAADRLAILQHAVPMSCHHGSVLLLFQAMQKPFDK